jgi:uncharacterized short protein YbdD (DUF466 family)
MRQGTNDGDGGRGKGEGALPHLSHVIRQLVGAPDYEAYLEHCRRAGHSPGLTEAAYVKEFFEAKGKTVRCC